MEKIDWTQCPEGRGHKTAIEGLERRVSNLEKALIALSNRLPNWATLLLMGLAGMCSALAAKVYL